MLKGEVVRTIKEALYEKASCMVAGALFGFGVLVWGPAGVSRR